MFGAPLAIGTALARPHLCVRALQPGDAQPRDQGQGSSVRDCGMPLARDVPASLMQPLERPARQRGCLPGSAGGFPASIPPSVLLCFGSPHFGRPQARRKILRLVEALSHLLTDCRSSKPAQVCGPLTPDQNPKGRDAWLRLCRDGDPVHPPREQGWSTEGDRGPLGSEAPEHPCVTL